MPPRTLALDLSRTSYVCNSCSTNLRLVHPPPWLVRHSSKLAQKQPPRSATSHAKLPKSQPPPSPAEMQQALAQARAEANDVPPSSVGSAEEPLDVRYFHEEAPGKYRRATPEEGFGSLGSELDTEIETSINDLEQQMVNTLQMLKTMENRGMQDKADELRKQFKRTLRDQYKGKTGPEAEDYGLLRIPGFSGPRQRAVANLNKFLARESVVKGGVPKPKDLTECWKFYSAARKTLSSSWGNVPRQVWDFLWMILSWEEGVDNANRMAHIYVLAKDMHAAGLVLRESQQLLAIEAMFIQGFQDEALESWKKAVAALGAKPETFKAYWELGVRMYCLHGDTDRAIRAADTLVKSKENSDPRIIIPIVRALAMNEETQEQAWTLYKDMRDLLGNSMKIEDYDEVIGLFLASNCTEHALQAFVDMMFGGAVDTRGKTRLPTAVGNHFFLGKWLKRLIGAGQPDHAYQVVVFLQTKGVVASPIQLNGLIGAWLRSEVAENVEKAEKLAWNMVHSRMEYVHLRRREALMDQRTRLFARDTPSVDGEVEEFDCRARATSETFSLLAENYASRGLHSRLEELWEISKQAEIGTTSFFLNQLIRSYSHDMQAEEAVNLYRTMTREMKVVPDGHTFLALFNTLSINRLVVPDEGLLAQDQENAREFFSDMVKSRWEFDSPELFSFLPRTILFSMLKLRDFAGVVIAARTMKEIFGFTPPEPLLIELATGSGNLRVKTKRNITKIMEGTGIIAGLIRRHRTDLARQGHDVDNLTLEQKTTELSEVLEQLVLQRAEAYNVDPAHLQRMLETAAHKMGVYDIAITKDPREIARHYKLPKESV
ncbi:hypothetical protein B0H63DRAFT_485096 [Podospora didyma]|uniref:Pentatricopeptide repeat-containing protein n=1 Tax=Podospora didyma TaxID=330526 RepID=A0AAE0KAV9_9PEZI|nr:hypothetical protein B0H63DRAFT_485096 [Podospora didyma]